MMPEIDEQHGHLAALCQVVPQRLHGQQRRNGIDLEMLPQAWRIHSCQVLKVLVPRHHQ